MVYSSLQSEKPENENGIGISTYQVNTEYVDESNPIITKDSFYIILEKDRHKQITNESIKIEFSDWVNESMIENKMKKTITDEIVILEGFVTYSSTNLSKQGISNKGVSIVGVEVEIDGRKIFIPYP